MALRGLGFEPVVIRESKSHFKRRADNLEKHALIDKPKGCDIALATRMVSDAAADLFDQCCLFSSDIDFLPAVEAVRRMGKVVMVAGYTSALGSRSPYLYVPDKFIDLEFEIRNAWTQYNIEIIKTLHQLSDLGAPRPSP